MVQFTTIALDDEEAQIACIKCIGIKTSEKIIQCSKEGCTRMCHLACRSSDFRAMYKKLPQWFCSPECGTLDEIIELNDTVPGSHGKQHIELSDKLKEDRLNAKIKELTTGLKQALDKIRDQTNLILSINEVNLKLQDQLKSAERLVEENEIKNEKEMLSNSDELNDTEREAEDVLQDLNKTLNLNSTPVTTPIASKSPKPEECLPPVKVSAFNHDKTSYAATSEGCSNATLKARERVRLRREQEGSTTSADVHAQKSQQYLTRIKLARQNLEDLSKFKGERLEWIAFEEEVYRTWDAGEFTDYEMIRKLRKALDGDAKNYVKLALNASEANPEHVMETLRRKYYHPNEAVSTAYKEITQLEAVRKKVRKPLENLLTAVENYIHVCNLVKITQHLNGRVNGEVETKLPNELRADWNKLIRIGMHDDGSRYGGTWMEFWNFLRDNVEDLPLGYESTSTGNVQSNLKKPPPRYDNKRNMNQLTEVGNNSQNNPKGKKVKSNQVNGTAKIICPYDECERGKLYQCTAFWLLPYEAKLKFINDRKLCHRCVSSIEHTARNCPLTNLQCRAANCQKAKEHATVLHPPNTGIVGHIYEALGFTSFQVLPIYIYDRNNKPIKVLAFLDGGSDTTIIDHEFLNALQLPSQPYKLDVGWCAGGISSTDKASRIFDCQISSVNEPDRRFNLRDVVTMKRFSLPKQGQNAKELRKAFPHLKNVPIPNYATEAPRILIGLQQKHLMVPDRIVKAADCPVVAELTPLGWTISGSIKQHRNRCQILQACTTRDDNEELTNEELHAIIRKFIDEDMALLKPIENYVSPEDKRANLLCEKYMKRIGNRYHVGFYWNSDNVKLPDNYALAEARLFSQEMRLRKLGMIDWANEHMQMLLDRGFARRATEEDLNPATPHENINYVMGFVTFNHNKIPPKPRWVVDPATTYRGTSLNSVLLKGPDNLVPLTQALFHFRERKYATVADVEKMYHQVMILAEFQNCQRILWRWGNSNEQPEIIIHQAMMFGPTDSPSKANKVRIDHATKSQKKYPLAARLALDSTYMDDCFNSEDDIETAVAAATQSIDMFHEISWELVDHRSNSQEVLNKLPKDRVNENLLIDLARDEAIDKYKVLGCYYDPVKDAFVYKQVAGHALKAKTQVENYVPNKRETLSFVMQHFDPLGLISHFIVRGRMIVQRTWASNLDWHHKLTDEIYEMWKEWLKEFDQIAELVVPRFYEYNEKEVKQTTLHVFSDAGADALATVAYFRFDYHDGRVHVQQVAAKTKVSPIRYLSIAKKELSAAVASVKIANTVKAYHKRMKVEKTTFYTDSEIVLKWIRNPTLKLMQFVAPRVTEIWDHTEVCQWRYVQSNENPADHGTKWKRSPINWSDHNHAWYQGPKFLWEKTLKVPVDAGHSDTTGISHRILLIKPTEHEKYYAGIFDFIKATVRADWMRYVTAVAGVMRFTMNLRLTINKQTIHKNIAPIITPEERENAIKRIILEVQRATWPCAFKAQSGGRFIRSRNSADLNALNPMISEDGMLRCCTRLSHEEAIPFDQRFPMILPAKHEVTDTIIRYYHEKNFHIAQETVIASLREKYWIVHARQAVRRIVAKCPTCIDMRKAPYQTPRAPLPSVRVTPTTKAFENVGVDVFGSFNIYTRRSKSTRQVWCVIFCCLVTRAVFMRMIDSLSGDEMLLAIQDLWTRRGPVKNIYSDNGTNFIKCASFLKDEHRKTLSVDKGISWHFNPPHSPQWGGVWERLIRDVKRAMKAAIGNITTGEKVFNSVLLQIEDILNRRPLTHLPTTPDDNEPLTPNMLIKMHPGSPLVTDESGDLDSETTIKKAKWYANQFRRRWVREYLPIIAKHPRKGQRRESLDEGDYVLYVDPLSHPSKWPKGVINRVYRGRDGIARVADIKLPDGSVIERRSSLRLAKLIKAREGLYADKFEHVVNVLYAESFSRNGFDDATLTPLLENPSNKSSSDTSQDEHQNSKNKSNINGKSNCEAQGEVVTVSTNTGTMKFTVENAIKLGTTLKNSEFFSFKEIDDEVQGTRELRLALKRDIDSKDRHNRKTIKFVGIPNYASIMDVIVWTSSLGMRPEWIQIENVLNKKLHIFFRNPDLAVNNDLLSQKKIEFRAIGSPTVEVQVAVPTIENDMLAKRGYEHTLVQFRYHDRAREHNVIISRVRDTEFNLKAMQVLNEGQLKAVDAAKSRGVMPNDWPSALFDLSGRESALSRIGERREDEAGPSDGARRMRSVIVNPRNQHRR